MKSLFSRHALRVCAALLLVVAGLLHAATSTAAEAAAAAAFERGPHNGRLLVDGDFMLELAIFEDGVPPEYHAWASSSGQALDPREFTLDITLTRLGGQQDRFDFAIVEDYLRSLQVVGEPHSFDVAIVARHGGREYRWDYPSYEGRVEMPAVVAAASGVTTAIAGPATIRELLRLQGQVSADPERVAEVSARFPGLIRRVTASIGSVVRAGEVLATVEANESLRTYDVLAPQDGVVIARHANPGEFAGAAPLFTVVDYSRLLLNLTVFPQQAQRVRLQQEVSVQQQGAPVNAVISVLTPAPDSATWSAHAELDNSSAQWTPGTWVAADVTVAEAAVPLAVDNRALQGFRDWQVVFIKIGDSYEIRPLELGRTDGRYTEVLGGLEPDDEYVVGNSYLFKADLEKSGASHDH
jgi:cobalt-zinc-cadmium efflux system membrane fusion protein